MSTSLGKNADSAGAAVAMNRTQAVAHLAEVYGLESWRATRVVEIAYEFGNKSEPVVGGYVTVERDGSNCVVRGNNRGRP